MGITLPRSRTKFLMIFGILLLVGLSGLAFYFYNQYTALRNNPNMVSQETTNRLVEKIGHLYALPKDEVPTVAEVKDREKLKQQPFFANSENNDYLLIYPNAKVAILYREKDDKLINVGPIAIDSNGQAQPAAAKPTVKVLNGTNVPDQATRIGAILTEKLAAAITVDAQYGDAKKKPYSKTMVVDVKGDKADLAQQIANAVGGSISTLPAGEEAGPADVLVLAGQ